MKFLNQLVISSLAVVVIAGCSSNPTERRQARDDFAYLDAQPLTPLNLPEGTSYQTYPNFEIPEGEYQGGIGKDVDIRPPQQVLELIPGARYERDNQTTSVWLVKQEERDEVWNTLLELIDEEGVDIVEQSDGEIETDWVAWRLPDEIQTLYSRHVFKKQDANVRFGIAVELIEWREGRRVEPVTLTERERYNTLMINRLTTSYDSKLRAEAEAEAQQLVRSIPVSMGTDKSGLPVIIARAEYPVFWQRVTTLLPEMGLDIEERNQSQGTVKVRYDSPGSEFWQQAGLESISLKEQTYTLLLGDLGSRTSINVTDNDGKPIPEAELSELVPVLRYLLDSE